MSNLLSGIVASAIAGFVLAGSAAGQVAQNPPQTQLPDQPPAQAPAPPEKQLGDQIPVVVASGFEIVLKVPEVETGLKATRALLIFAKVSDKVKEPRFTLQDWNSPPQVLGADWNAVDGKMTVSNSWNGNPENLADIEPGVYWVQAVVRRNLDGCFPGGNAGDAFSESMLVRLDPKAESTAVLEVTKVHTEPAMPTNTRAKLFSQKSELLSKFYDRDVVQRAGVFLPKDFDKNPDKMYPVVVFVGGFGSTHYSLGSMARNFPAEFLTNIIFVVPDPSTYYGHGVFADSENNGPRGRALVEEFLPAIEKQFRGKGAEHRYVTGISSGGWSSLWLQITYPDQFAGCWSFCPDPVDFRDFQQIDLYGKDANMYSDARGARRPLARRDDIPTLWYEDFVKMESAIGASGQIGAFEAVFSGKGKDGKPIPLFDRETGAVDPVVAKSWEKYDIRLLLENNWSELSKKLPGKIHIYAGGKDTFYLDGAARLLKTSLKSLASDAIVEVVPGLPHTIFKPGVTGMVRDISMREGFPSELNQPKTGVPTTVPPAPK